MHFVSHSTQVHWTHGFRRMRRLAQASVVAFVVVQTSPCVAVARSALPSTVSPQCSKPRLRACLSCHNTSLHGVDAVKPNCERHQTPTELRWASQVCDLVVASLSVRVVLCRLSDDQKENAVGVDTNFVFTLVVKPSQMSVWSELAGKRSGCIHRVPPLALCTCGTQCAHTKLYPDGVTRTCFTHRVKADGLVGGDVHGAMQSQGLFQDAVDVWAHAKSKSRLSVLVDVVSPLGGLDVHLLKELQRDVALGVDEPLLEILQSRSVANDDVSRGDGQGDLHLAFLCLRLLYAQGHSCDRWVRVRRAVSLNPPCGDYQHSCAAALLMEAISHAGGWR